MSCRMVSVPQVIGHHVQWPFGKCSAQRELGQKARDAYRQKVGISSGTCTTTPRPYPNHSTYPYILAVQPAPARRIAL